MGKYRKKPVVIEAVKLENNYESIYNAVEFIYNIGMETSVIGANATVRNVQESDGLDIITLEGTMRASFGDWVIKGVNGEFYPCKPDIFEKTYDRVIELPQETHLADFRNPNGGIHAPLRHT